MKMLSSKVLNLGYVDENLHTKVIIDCSEVLWDYPGASVSMVVRPPRGDLYPVTPDRDNDNNIIWELTASDLVYAGTGQIQLTFTDSGEIIKSIIGTTKVLPSLETTGEAPEPLQNWMDEAEQTAEEIATAAVGDLIDDTAGAGDTDKVWSAGKTVSEIGTKISEPSSDGTDGQVLATDGSGGRYWRTVSGGGGGGGGTTDYSELTNKPQINSVTLTGNKSLSDLGIAAASAIPDVSGKADKVSSATNGHFAGLDSSGNLVDSGKSASDFGTYSKPSGGIPSTDLASAVQTSLGKANSAYQKPSGGIPSTDLTQAVQTSLGKADTAYQKPVSGIPDSDLVNSYIKEPSSEGTSGQVLATNGSGTRYWTTVQGGTGGTTDYSDLTNKPQVNSVTLSGNKSLSDLGVAPASKVYWATPEDYGAVGDGVTDDSQAVQDACDAGDDVYFASGKTYYLASPVTVNKSIRLHGGTGATIKTKTPSGGVVNEGIRINGTLKATTTLTSSYYSTGEYTLDNCGNKLTLANMSSVEIGDLVQIRTTDTDQRYAYSRRYYYLGGIFKVVDKYDGHIYINRDMPFDITLSNNLTVYVYDAPVVEVENLNFESDLDSFGTSTYNALLDLKYCKDSVIRQCYLHNMKIGFMMQYCVNTLIDGVQVSKSRWANESGMGDGYAIAVDTCTNTVIERVVSLCAQGCIDMGGYEPIFDTFISHCNLASECRAIGLDMHENSYNLVIEDCVMGGASVFGMAKINRCQFIANNRPGIDTISGITFRGSHDPRWSQLRVSNCEFASNSYNFLSAQIAQDNISTINSIWGRVVFEHCRGGSLQYTPPTNAFILSNTVNYLELNDWQDCKEFYHDPNQAIKTMVVRDCTFTENSQINKHTGLFNTDGIATAVIRSTDPSHSRRVVSTSFSGGQYVLPANVTMNLSSTDSSTLYIVCGDNCASNVPSDWHVGSVSGSSGSPISKTPNTTVEQNLTVNSAGNLVFTQPSSTSNYAIYPQCMMQAQEMATIRISAKLKNTGATSGNSYRAFIAVIDPSTGNLTYRNNGTSATATAEGAVISHSRDVPKGHIAMAYLGSYSAVANSVTTFEEFHIEMMPFAQSAVPYTEYNGSHRAGNGTLQSVQGINNVMSSADTFSLAFDSVEERGISIGTWQGGSY